jgi:tetratricopeptide (TPR) repeat protein
MLLLVSIQKRNVVLRAKDYLFPRRHALRFEWFALLAYKRKVQSGGEGWVTLEQIQRLPLWRGKTKHHIGTNVGRYIQELDNNGIELVEARSRWRGPYRLKVPPSEIGFDISMSRVARYLGEVRRTSLNRDELYHFTHEYCRAISLYFQGRLSPSLRTRKRQQANALGKLLELSHTKDLDARLRLMTNLAAVRVLDSLGKASGAAMTLDDSKKLLKQVRDPVMIAKFYLADVWKCYRTGDDIGVEKSLAYAKALSGKSTDLSVNASAMNYDGLQLSAKGDYDSALKDLLQALYTRLPTENFDAIQASCFNVGNTLQRMGEPHYEEAEKWLRLCLDICKWMNIGRYEATSEIILSKIALESGRTRTFFKWIKEAEAFAERSGNPSDKMWCQIMRAFYSQQQKAFEDAIEHLVRARQIYLRIPNWKTPDKYLRRKFPEIWDEVVDRLKGS